MNAQVTRVKIMDNAKTGSTSSHVRVRLDTSVIHVLVRSQSGNGRECKDGVNKFTCTCPAGYLGKTCAGK